MAFGKSKEVLDTVGSFGQTAASFSGNKFNKGKGGGVGYFFNSYKPSTTDADTIRIVFGLYDNQDIVGEGDDAKVVTRKLPFYKFVEHFDGREMRSVICSAGPFVNFKDKREPCAGCDIHWATLEKGADGKSKSRMSRQTKYGLSVIDTGKYHKVPQVDQATGKVKMNPRTNEPFTNWVKCSGLNCDACRAQYESKVGHAMHWILGWGHWENLRQMDGEIGKSCMKCKGEGTVSSLAWVCRSCGGDAVEMRTTTLKRDEIDKIVQAPFECSCGYTGFLEEFVSCSNCHAEGFANKHEGEVDEIRATLFDVDLHVKAVTTGQNNQTILNIRWSAPKPVDPKFVELNKPLELEKIFEATAFKTQCDKFKYTPGAPGPAVAKAYGTGSAVAPQTAAPASDGSQYR